MEKISMDPKYFNYDITSNKVILDLLDKIKGSSLNSKFLYIVKKYSMHNKFVPGDWVVHRVEYADSFCICSHPINECIYIRNVVSGNVLRVGNICVKNLWGDQSSIFKSSQNLLNQLKYLQSDGEYRMCLACGKHKIHKDQPDYITVCNLCFKSGLKKDVGKNVSILNGKKCGICRKQIINPGDWRDKCTSCYKTTVMNTPMKNCLDCGKNIPADPNWKKVCISCYKNKNK